MSRDLVYLYELDFPTRRKSFSLEEFRKLPKVIYAYEVIYKTLFIENKDIVLSYDQLVESLFFQYWYEYDPETVKKLFRDNRFRISKFRDIKSPLDFLKRNLKNDDFRFSGSIENLNFKELTQNEVKDIKDAMSAFIDTLDIEPINNCSVLKTDREDNHKKMIKYCRFLLSITSILVETDRPYIKAALHDRYYISSDLLKVFITHNINNDFRNEKTMLQEIYQEIEKKDINKLKNRSVWYSKLESKIPLIYNGSDSEELDKIKTIYDAIHCVTIESSIEDRNIKSLSITADEDYQYQYIKDKLKLMFNARQKQKSDVNDIYIDKDFWRLTIESPVYDYSENLICCKNISKDKQYYCLYKNIAKFTGNYFLLSLGIVFVFIILTFMPQIVEFVFKLMDNNDNGIITLIATIIVQILFTMLIISLAQTYKIKFKTIFTQTWDQLKMSVNDFLIMRKIKKIFKEFKDKDKK